MARVKQDRKPPKRKWVDPKVVEMRAGSAEFTPGNSITDGPLETIGS